MNQKATDAIHDYLAEIGSRGGKQPKHFSPAELRKRRQRMRDAQKLRWKKPPADKAKSTA